MPLNRHTLRLVVLTALVLLSGLGAQAAEIGPDRGTLVIVGGGGNIEEALHRFVELAGGRSAPIVVIPTANGAPTYDQHHRAAVWFRDEAGLEDVVVLHTDDRKVADSEDFLAPIRRARGVWFPGGRQWRLADSYLGTRTQTELEALLARGGVIGGTSAGATIQGSYLARGDTRTNVVMMGDHEEGFGFLRDVAIDQHLLKRNRQFDLLEIVEARPELLGIGIDEDTAIVVRGDTFRVLGEGYVAIYDPKKPLRTGGGFYFLSPGDSYDLARRTPLRPGLRTESFAPLFAETPSQP